MQFNYIESVWFFLGWGAAALWMTAVGVLVTSTIGALLHRHLRCAILQKELPPLRMIRPISGAEFMLDETTQTALTQDHPQLGVTLSVAREDDTALPIIRPLVAAAASRADVRLNVGETFIGGNPKINNMFGAVEDCTEDDLLFTDSNTQLSRFVARDLQGRSRTIGGIASCMPEGVAPASMAAWVECAILNQHHLRLTLMGDLLGVSGVHGKAMALSRQTLNQMGGLKALSLYPGDDLGIMLLAWKLKIPAELAPVTVAVPLGTRSWPAVWARQKRWGQARWQTMPGTCIGELFMGALPSALAGGLALTLLGDISLTAWFGLGLAHVSFWLLADVVVALARRQVFGWLTPFASLIRELCQPFILLSALFDRKILWRGHTRYLETRK